MKPTGPVFDKTWRAACRLEEVSRSDPRADAMIRRHYLGRWPGVCVLNLLMLRDAEPLGLIVFALPPRESNKRYGGTVWELARLWVDDRVPTNAETWLIAAATRLIKTRGGVDVLLSYADPSAGHSGVIYRAAGWEKDGRTDDERKTPRFDYADAATGKKYSRRGHVPIGVEIARVPRVSKYRYFKKIGLGGRN